MSTIIAKNVTLGEIFLDDLGVSIAASSSLTLTLIFQKRFITDSQDLKDQVSSGDIVINDGTEDLSVEDGLFHIKFETQYEDKEGPRPTWSTEQTPPNDPSDGDGWIDPDTNILYIYDELRGSWLSVIRNRYLYQRSGIIFSDWLKVGSLSGSDIGYLMPRDGTIVSFNGRVTATNADGKGFQIYQNNSIILDKFCPGTQAIDTTSNIDVSGGTILKVKTKVETQDSENWYDVDWQYRKSITIDADQVSGSTAHEDFPLYVTITNSDLNKAREDGEDIIFVDATSNVKLDHEIESFTRSTGALIAWVRIPELDPSVDRRIDLYYGSDSTGNQNITGVWASKYAAVWHFNEDGGPYLDATQNNNDGSATNAPVRTATGTVGPFYQDFNGTDDVITVPNSASLNITGNTITLQVWYRNPAGGEDEDTAIIIKGPSVNQERYMLGVDGGPNPEPINKRVTTSAGHFRYDNSSWTRGAWNLVHTVYNGALGSNPRFFTYKNGSLATSNNASGSLLSNTDSLLIGKRIGSERYLNGDLDELRVLNVALSTDWIATEWANQNTPASFYSLGAEEDRDNVLKSCTNPMIELEVAWRK